MRRIAKVSLSIFLSGLLCRYTFAIPKTDYFTEAELDLIRDAQELSMRVPVYIKLAERRLIFLGLLEQSEKEREKERKEREKREKEAKKASTKGGIDTPAPVDDLAYLDEFSPAELLRGYSQAIEEIQSNIDDAYSRKLDVRDSLEDLEKFTRETIPLLQKFKPRNNSDRAVLQLTIDKAAQALADTKEALKIVPKTEKKRK